MPMTSLLTPTPSDDKGATASSMMRIGGAAATVGFAAWYLNRRRRSHWTQDEEDKYGHEALHSIIEHFKSLSLDPETTVDEANKRRTASYYEKARQAHSNQLVVGVGSRSRLLKLRRTEVGRILSYWRRGDQSHRAIVAMCDPQTQRVLSEARTKILDPLNHSTDLETSGVWIPELSIIPPEDMHVTVALPWWWHTIRGGNHELSREMAARFRQTLLLEFHYPFQIEFERIVLLGGKVLVALWRCVGERTTEDGMVIYDRHGESVDPFVRLREEIVRCYTTESPDSRRQPLTYQHKKSSSVEAGSEKLGIPPPPTGKMERQHTIEKKTPGFGQMGKADGFIHTTLCRLPLECLSPHDVELGQIHRLCREASAALSGHRMVISKYRFIESMGEGGESNPCVNPLYEETIDAPVPHRVDIDGKVTENSRFQNPHTAEGSLTIGPGRNFLGQRNDVAKPSSNETNLVDLFERPEGKST